MEDLNDKVTGSSTPLTAAQWNQIPGEQQNTITTSGQSLSGSDLNQLSKAISHYISSGTFYSDSGTVNSYVLNSVDSNRTPPAYVDGMEVEFIVGNTNTALSTITPPGLASADITGTAVAGLITAGDMVRFRYDSGSGEFGIIGRQYRGARLKVADYLTSDNAAILDRPYLLADGSAVNRTDYAELFAKIGTAFGIGDGATTFNLPNLPASIEAVNTNAVSWADPGLSPTNNLREIAIDTFNDDVYITDQTTNLVYRSIAGLSVFSAFGNFSDTLPSGIAVNQKNGDVWAVAGNANEIYRARGGVEDFALVGTYSTDVSTPSPDGIAINSENGDIWISDNGASPGRVFVLRSGDTDGTYIEAGGFPVGGIAGIAVNSKNGDVWCVITTEAYKSAGGIAAFVATGSYPGSNGLAIAIDSKNNDVWIINAPVGADAFYRSLGGTANFASAGSSPSGETSSRGIAVNSITGDLWLTDDTSGAGAVYKADGSVLTAATPWYIKYGLNPAVITPPGTWDVQGTYLGSQPLGMSIDSSNDDVWFTDSSGDVYKLTAGIGTYATVGTYTDFDPRRIAVDSSNQDVWITDGDGTGPFVNKLTGGSGSYVNQGTYPGSSPNDIAVDSSNQDVWIVDNVDDDIYKLTAGAGSYNVVGTYPGSDPAGIAVDPATGDVYVSDGVGGDNAIYKLTAGIGSYVAIGTYPGSEAAEIAFANGNLYIYDAFSSDVYVLYSAALPYTIVPVTSNSDLNGGIASDSSGDIWVANGTEPEILKYS